MQGIFESTKCEFFREIFGVSQKPQNVVFQCNFQGTSEAMKHERIFMVSQRPKNLDLFKKVFQDIFETRKFEIGVSQIPENKYLFKNFSGYLRI